METLLQDLVFVYGSLRRGQRNHHFLGASRFLGMHKTAPDYTMLVVGAYPGVIARGQHSIVGEIYRVSAATLAQLDLLEECPEAYERKRIVTSAGRAWMYLYRHATGAEPVVHGGDWSRYSPGASSNTSNRPYQS